MTFSIVGFDRTAGEIGAAVSTASAACGKRVIHYSLRAGLVVTQGKTNVNYGVQGLAMLQASFSSAQTLSALRHLDSNWHYRQVLVSDLAGNWEVFTGESTEPWRGQVSTADFVAIGNTLAGQQVLDAMATNFACAKGDLASRLTASLVAGDTAGGDREGKRSAALVVLSPAQFEPYGALVDLRVDYDDQPVRKLAETLRHYREWESQQLARIDRRVYYFDPDGQRAKHRDDPTVTRQF